MGEAPNPDLIGEIKREIRAARQSGNWPLTAEQLDAIGRRLIPESGTNVTVDIIDDPVSEGFSIRVVGKRHAMHPALNALTPREKEIARLAAKGLTNKQIAGQLGIATSTVKDHVSNILSRTGLRRRVDLAAVIGPGA